LDWSPQQRYDALVSHPTFAGTWTFRSQEELLGGYAKSDPYVDDGFLRFVATLPPLALLHGNFRRGLLREAMRGLVPEDVRLRETKAGFTPALVRTLELLGGFGIFRHLAEVRMLADLGLVEPNAFRAAFERAAAAPLREALWDVLPSLSVEAFLRECAGERQDSFVGALA
jgi:asparagine synthase (glutamine-hydrolysing)